MKRHQLLFVLPIVFAVMLPSLAPAQDRDQELEGARALFKELKELRAKMDEYMKEVTDLNTKMNQASPEELEELKSQRLLRERAMERLSVELKEKSKNLFDRLSNMIIKDPSSVELRELRYEAAFTLERYDVALEDIQKVPKKEKDHDFLMIWSQSLASLYRFEEAAERYKEALKLESSPYVRFLLADCYFNAHQFTKATEEFAALAEDAPPEEKQQFIMAGRQAAEYVKLWEQERYIREQEVEKDDNPLVVLALDKGRVKLELFEDQAPNTVANFISLVEQGFYDGLAFHRVIRRFMAQAGDPEGTGRGGPGYTIADECRQPNARKHFVGSLSMANTGQPDSNGSQFFLTLIVTYWLNNKHTVFGRILEGQDVVNRIEQGDKIISAKVLRKRDHEYKVIKK